MNIKIPTSEHCEELLASQNVADETITHSRMVRDVARRIGRDLKWLRDRGPNLSLITAGALLHDIAKEQPNHAQAGADLLREHGYDQVADIVESHNELEFSGELPVTEKEIVFIADKLVKGDQMVTVAYMYDHKIQNCKDNPQAAHELQLRKEIAMRIKASIEHETGKNLEELAIAEE